MISDEEDDEEEDSEENEAFVGEEESEADPISRFGYYTLNYGDTDSDLIVDAKVKTGCNTPLGNLL